MGSARFRRLAVAALVAALLLCPAAPRSAQGAEPDGVRLAADDDDDDAKKKKKRRKKKKKKDPETKPDEPPADDAPADEVAPPDETPDEAPPAPAEPPPGDEPAAAPDPAAAVESDSAERAAATARREVVTVGEPLPFDLRLDFSVFSRDALGRVAGGLTFGFNLHHALALDARLAYGGGRDERLEFLSAELAVRARPLRFLDESNLAGSLVVQTGYGLFFGTEAGDAAALPVLIGFEYRTPAGAHFLALAGPTLLFLDAATYHDVFPEARAGFGWSF